MAARNQGKGTYTSVGHFKGLPVGRQPMDWVIQFRDGLFYVADDEEPTADLDKALVLKGLKNAQAELQIVTDLWVEPAQIVRKDRAGGGV